MIVLKGCVNIQLSNHFFSLAFWYVPPSDMIVQAIGMLRLPFEASQDLFRWPRPAF